MKTINRNRGYFRYDADDALEKIILLRGIAGSLVIIVLYIGYGILIRDFQTAVFSAMAFVVYVSCYVAVARTNGTNASVTSRRVAMGVIVASAIFGFFNQGGFFGITALHLCGLVIFISAVFSGTERRIFVGFYIIMVVFFTWVHIFRENWILDYQSIHSREFLMAEMLVYIFYILYIGYLYKEEYEKKRLFSIATTRELEEANEEISAQNDYITAYNCQLKKLVSELHAERNKVLDTNRELRKANSAIARQNEYITAVNSNLEKIVHERTKDIKELNRKIVGFAQYNAHRIRSPLARILGLINIMNIDFNLNKVFSYEQSEFYLENLQQNAGELDEMVRGVSKLLDENHKLLKD